jgi:proline dehydrogenase
MCLKAISESLAYSFYLWHTRIQQHAFMVESSALVNFQDTKVAYQSKSNRDLRRARLLYRLLQNPAISGPSQALMRLSVKWGLPVKPLIKATLYRQFIGGETREECTSLARTLAPYKVQTVLDYAAEGEESEEAFQQKLEEFKNNIDLAAEEPSIPISVFKPSAIARNQELTTLSTKPKDQWTEDEEASYQKIWGRFNAIFSRAYHHQVPVMIDAEESWTQNIVDELALAMMRTYNGSKPLVMNTYQLYRKDRLAALKEHHQEALKSGVFWGGKLVRGAYLEKERQVAKEAGKPSPIHDSKADTDADFDSATAYCIQNIDSCAIMVATHNQSSVEKAAEALEQRGLARNHAHVWFSQLYGMADQISFNLADEGFRVAKYTPYGPVKAVVPYLIRRAEENSAVQGQVQQELEALQSELKRRRNGKA